CLLSYSISLHDALPIYFFGVESVRHTLDFEARQFRTEAVAAGRVIGGRHRWLQKQTRPGQAAPLSPELVVGGGRVLPKPTGLVKIGKSTRLNSSHVKIS